jgi:beta-mannosidase
VQVINNKPEAVPNLVAHVAVYNLDGSLALEHETKLTAAPDVATSLGPIDFPASVSAVHFIKLDLRDAAGRLLSTNFYWRAQTSSPDDLTALNQLPMVKLTANVAVLNEPAIGQRKLRVTLRNPTQSIALMAHVQLRRKSAERILPAFYSDNYVSLVPGETKTIEVEAAASAFKGESALIVFDGWNVTVAPGSFAGASIAPNLDAQPDRWPATGLPFATAALR